MIIKQFNSKKAQLGMTLQEMMLVFVVVAVVTAIAVGVFNNLRGGVAADDMASKTLLLASNVQKHWRNAGSYASLSAENVDKIALVEKPLRMEGTNMLDAWGNTMNISGGQSAFAITIGGSTNPINKEDCATLANNLSSIASSIRIGADAAVGSGATAGTVTGGNLFKTGTTIDQSALIDGCNAADTIVAAQFR